MEMLVNLLGIYNDWHRLGTISHKYVVDLFKLADHE